MRSHKESSFNEKAPCGAAGLEIRLADEDETTLSLKVMPRQRLLLILRRAILLSLFQTLRL